MRFALVPRGALALAPLTDEPQRAEDEKQRRLTASADLYVGVTEVTNGEFRRFRPGHVTSGWDPEVDLNQDIHPVASVSWTEARAFCDWLSARSEPHIEYRLPTEEEWEYFARSETTTAAFWGDDAGEAGRFANVADATFAASFARSLPESGERRAAISIVETSDGFAEAAPVGSFLPNPWGLYDVIGNAWEWCASPDPGRPNQGARGGSWANADWHSGHRAEAPIATKNYNLGFRVVYEANER